MAQSLTFPLLPFTYASDPLSFFIGIARKYSAGVLGAGPASLDHLPDAEHPHVDAIETMQREEDRLVCFVNVQSVDRSIYSIF